MSTNTNGIATQANLYSLNSEAFPNWSGGLKCPTKSEILSGVNSNFTATITNNNNYSDNQLVKYSDISINENRIMHTLNVTIHYFEDSIPWPSGEVQFIDVAGKIGEDFEIFVHPEYVTSSGVCSYPLTFRLPKNVIYTVNFKSLSGVKSGSLNWYNHSMNVDGTTFSITSPTNPVTGTIDLFPLPKIQS